MKLKEKELEEQRKREKEKELEEENNENKYTLLNNGILIRKIKTLNGQNFNNYINRTNVKKNNINNYNYKNNNNDDNRNIKSAKKLYFYEDNKDNKIKYIKKPKKCFMTKYFMKKRKKKIFTAKARSNSMPKNEYSNKKKILNVPKYNKLTTKKIKTSEMKTNIDSTIPTQTRKSKVSINRNIKYQFDKFDEKFPSLTTITAKKYSINSGINLFYNSSNKKTMNQKRPQSSYNVIKKEIDFNVKSSKNNNTSFYNKSFSMQKTCQISTFIKNKKEIMYENKYFLDDFKDLKNAFELSSNNNIMPRKNIMSAKVRKKIKFEDKNSNNKKRDFHLFDKAKKLLSDKNIVKSYKYIYPKDPSPLFVEFHNANNSGNEIKINNNVCKCGYKKHFGNEEKCPICISVKEKNIIREKKLSNLNYYFPFKDKNNTTASLQNSFRSWNNSFSNKNYNCKKYENFINYEMPKKDKDLPVNLYSPFYYTKINIASANNRAINNKFKVNNLKQIKSDKKIKLNKYEVLKEYLE